MLLEHNQSTLHMIYPMNLNILILGGMHKIREHNQAPYALLYLHIFLNILQTKTMLIVYDLHLYFGKILYYIYTAILYVIDY